MYSPTRIDIARRLTAAALLAILAAHAHADVVTDWNVKSGEFIAASKLGTPPAIRVMAIVQTAVSDAAHAAYAGTAAPAPGVSMDAAVAAANRVTLAKLLPAQQRAIDTAYHAALAAIRRRRREDGGRRRRRTGSRGARWRCAPTMAPPPRTRTVRTPARAPTCPPPRPRFRSGCIASPG